jgi:hypothetical protein
MDRLQFCISMLGEKKTREGAPIFNNMHNIVHIDEKWFVMTKVNRNYYLLPEEADPIRTVQSKHSIGKVMFLTAVARPRYDSDSQEKLTFSGKIGVWPFVKEMPAQRKSDNRPRGTLETKTIKVTRDVMREFIIDKLLPAIQACWPLEDAGKTIYIQQDNARPHILPDDEEFQKAVLKTGLDIKLMQQPANSPDLNVLDLGFFSSIQSLTDSRSPTTLQDLIHDVEEEFAGYAVNKLNRIFLTLQACMTEVINHVGGNGYSIPHVNKEKLEKLDKLPTSISCPLEVYQNGLQALAAAMQEAKAKQEEEAQAAAREAEAKQCEKQKSSKHKPRKKKQKPSNASTSRNGSTSNATTSNAQAVPAQAMPAQVVM